jgi:hypothetical protein
MFHWSEFNKHAPFKLSCRAASLPLFHLPVLWLHFSHKLPQRPVVVVKQVAFFPIPPPAPVLWIYSHSPAFSDYSHSKAPFATNQAPMISHLPSNSQPHVCPPLCLSPHTIRHSLPTQNQKIPLRRCRRITPRTLHRLRIPRIFSLTLQSSRDLPRRRALAISINHGTVTLTPRPLIMPRPRPRPSRQSRNLANRISLHKRRDHIRAHRSEVGERLACPIRTPCARVAGPSCRLINPRIVEERSADPETGGWRRRRGIEVSSGA